MASSSRRYDSRRRKDGAEATKARVLQAALALFARHGIDAVTIAQIARKAGVAVPTVYAIYQSKAGILRSLMERTLFGPRYQSARERLAGETDAARLIALTGGIARSIWESEGAELGVLRGASSFSPGLRVIEREFEAMRLAMQEERVRLLFEQSKVRRGLTFERARQLLWMYTSRDIYRMLVDECGWSPEQYQHWLSETLAATLIEPALAGKNVKRRRSRT